MPIDFIADEEEAPSGIEPDEPSEAEKTLRANALQQIKEGQAGSKYFTEKAHELGFIESALDVPSALKALVNIPNRLTGQPDYPPLVSPEQVKKIGSFLNPLSPQQMPQDEASQRVMESGAHLGSELTAPENALAAVAAKRFPVPVSTYFAGETLGGVPETTQRLLESKSLPEAAGNAVPTIANLVFAGLLGKHLMGPNAPAIPSDYLADGRPRPIPFPREATEVDMATAQRKVADRAEVQKELDAANAQEAVTTGTPADEIKGEPTTALSPEAERAVQESKQPETVKYHYDNPESKAWWEQFDRLQADVDAKMGTPEMREARNRREAHNDLAYTPEGRAARLRARRIEAGNPLSNLNVSDSPWSTEIGGMDAEGWGFTGEKGVNEDGRSWNRVESPDGKKRGVVYDDILHPRERAELEKNTKQPETVKPVEAAPDEEPSLTPEQIYDASLDPEHPENVTTADVDAFVKKKDEQPTPPKPEPPKAGTEVEIVGMGGAVPGEFTPSSKTATGIKNAAVDAERQSRGLPTMLAPERLKNSVVWDRVMARIDREPGWQDQLIDELKESPRTPSQDEIIALDHRYVDLQNEYAKATRDGTQAYADGRMEDVEDAKARAATFENKLNELEHIAKQVGTEWGRSGQMRQRLMREDFTLQAMESRRRAAHGFEPLSEQEHADILKDFNEMKVKLQAAQEAEAVAKEKAAKAEMDKALAEARATVAQGPSYAPGVLAQAERFAKLMDKAGDDALARLKARLGRTSAGVDPLILSDAAIYAAAKITRGLVDTAKWISELGEWSREHIDAIKAAGQRVLDEKQALQEKTLGKGFADKVKKAVTDTADEKKTITDALAEAVNEGADEADIGRYARALAENYIEEQVKGGRPPNAIPGKEITGKVHAILKDILPEMTEVEARDAWTQYGKYKSATTDPVRKRLIQASEEERKLSTLERLQKGEPGLKTGQQRVEATDLSRRRTKEINELNKKLGIRTTDPASQLRSTLDAIHTRNKNRIADLRFENATRRRIVRNKAPTPSDAESIAQRAEIDRLKKENDAIFGDKTLTPEQRLARAIAAAERNATEADAALARAKKGDYGTGPSGAPLPASVKLEAIKAKSKAAREEIAHLKDLDAAFQDAKRVKNQTRQLGEIDRRIEEVTRQINEGDIDAKKAPTKPLLAELAAKRGELADLNKIKQQLRNATKPRKTDAEIALQARKTGLANEIAFLKDRLAKGDFSPRRMPPTEPLDPAVARARAEVTLLREKFNRGTEHARYLAQSKAARIWAGTKEALNLSRAIMTSWDVSAVLRQGAFIVFGNPVRAVRAMKPMFEALFSEKKTAAVNEQIMARPNAQNGNYAKSKLYIAPREGSHLSAMEENYMSRLVHKIPGVHASERAYITFLNRLRADTFDALHDSLMDKGKGSQAELEAIANYVNVATGRGNLGKLAGAGEALSTVFFAPRLVASRFQLLAGQPLYHGSAATRFIVAKEYAKMLAGLAVVYGIGKMAGGTVESDSRSSDFGKIKFGNTRLDPLAGLSQVTVLLSRLGTGEMKTPHGIQRIRGKAPFGRTTSADLMARFLRTKLSPAIGTGVDVLTGKNVVGEKVTPGSVAINTLTPLSFQDIYQVMKEQGMAEGTIIAILAAFGMSVQNYHTK